MCVLDVKFWPGVNLSGEMVRWRYCLVLATMLLLPARTGSKLEDDEDEE